MLVAFSAAGQDMRIDEQLHMYEDLCEQCMDIKSRAKSGENVSRTQVESLIATFLALNKTLKSQENEMTAAQRHRSMFRSTLAPLAPTDMEHDSETETLIWSSPLCNR